MTYVYQGDSTSSKKQVAVGIEMPDQVSRVRSFARIDNSTHDTLQLLGTGAILRPVKSCKPLHGLLSPSLVKSGYLPRNAVVDTVINRSLALFCIVSTAPIMLLLSLLVLATSGRPIIYSGKRLGRNKVEFNIFKFRTLHPEATSQTASSVLAKRTLLETRIGSYLRTSRLDELPQLFNILKGDMVFFGPRPIRPEMLPVFEREVEGLAVRFTVRPGLVGMSQALLPHGASKRMRGRYARMYCRAKIDYSYNLLVVARVGIVVLWRGLLAIISLVKEWNTAPGQFSFVRSSFAVPKKTNLKLYPNGVETTAGLLGISDQILQFATALPITATEIEVVVSRTLGSGRIVNIALDVTVASVVPVGPGQAGFITYATYSPKSAFQLYRIERYLLDACVLTT